MKKILALLFAVVLSNCEIEIKPKEVKAQSVFSTHGVYNFESKTIDGMKYGIWSYSYNSGGEVAAIAVVNLTKDALEVELLQKQLSSKSK